MWIFTKYGFFSAVCARQGDGSHGRPVDVNRIMVRARLREHLEALKARFPTILGRCKIQEFVGTDYAYRLFIGKSSWSRILAEMAEETDYDNFKSAVAKHQIYAASEYEHALHDVWSVMNELQEAASAASPQQKAGRESGYADRDSTKKPRG